MARVLIVDDEKSIRDTLSEFVLEDGHEPLTAEDGHEALEVLRAGSIDIVVTDILLPKVTGMTLLGRIHEAWPEVQVIVITGRPTVDTAATAVREGAFDYLTKPISRNGIRAVVASAARVKELADERTRLERENRQYWKGLEATVERTAAALRRSEANYRSVVENANEAVFVIQAGGLRLVNPKAIGITGYPRERLLAMPFAELIHSEDREMVADQHRRVAGGDALELYAARIITASGGTRWVEIRPVPMAWEGRAAILAFATDVTDRVEAERERQESEARYRMLFESSPISLWQEDFSRVKAYLDDLAAGGVDLETYLPRHAEVVDECIRRIRVEDVNQATLEMYGVATKEALLAHLTEAITPESRAQFLEPLLAIAAGRTAHERITVNRRLDGSAIRVAVRWAAAPGYERSLRRVLVSNVDMTARVEAEEALGVALQGTIGAIGLATELRDPYTAGHQRRVTELAVEIARAMGMEETRIKGIEAAGLMHDIGKMAIPAEILSKPSALTSMERALIESHPQAAYDILKAVSFPWPLAQIVLQHHERMDGTGYPRGLREDEILPEARILAVADTVEAMASHRPYRPSLGIGAALKEIKDRRGTRYDPAVVDACLRLFLDQGFSFAEGEALPAGTQARGSTASRRSIS